jgi:hypothetical protein
MKKTILTIATLQFAAASEHQDRAHHGAHASVQFRDNDAHAAPV